MAPEQIKSIVKNHHMDYIERDGDIFLLVPWSQRQHDGSFMSGEDEVRVWDLRSLRSALGY